MPILSSLKWWISLALLPVSLPLDVLRSALWYARPSGGQSMYAVALEDQTILMKGSETWKGLWGLLTCPFRRLPDLVVLGAAKSGTTSLVDWLRQHEEVHGGWITKENGHYFLGRSLFRTAFELDRRFGLPFLNLDRLVYRSFFPTWLPRRLGGTPAGVVVEGVPTLRFPEVARRIAAAAGRRRGRRATAVIVLRDPIDRAYSHYCMLKGCCPAFETRTFEEAVDEELAEEPAAAEGTEGALSMACFRAQSLQPVLDASVLAGPGEYRSGSSLALWWFDKRYLRGSQYERLIPPFLRAFGKENIVIMRFRDLVARPQETCDVVLAKMGLNPFRPGQLVASSRLNASKLEGSVVGGARGLLRADQIANLESLFKPTETYLLEEFQIEVL